VQEEEQEQCQQHQEEEQDTAGAKPGHKGRRPHILTHMAWLLQAMACMYNASSSSMSHLIHTSFSSMAAVNSGRLNTRQLRPPAASRAATASAWRPQAVVGRGAAAEGKGVPAGGSSRSSSGPVRVNQTQKTQLWWQNQPGLRPPAAAAAMAPLTCCPTLLEHCGPGDVGYMLNQPSNQPASTAARALLSPAVRPPSHLL
jgi:hypothetical protein